MKNITILFVDDEKHLLDSLKHNLRNEPYKKQFVNSGNEALKIINSEPIQIIVSGMKMPEMNGLELLKLVKNQYPEIIRIVLSAYIQPAQIIPCINTGEIYRYITKPIELSIFKQMLNDAIDYFYTQQKNIDLLKNLKNKNEELELSNKKHIHIEKKMLDLIPYDNITALPNYKSFNDTIEKEWQRARRTQKPLSLIKIYIENYTKLINKFEHQIVNGWLREIVAVLRKILKRPGDLLTRFNNNEFAIILPETVVEGAGKIAGIIQQKFETLPLKHKTINEVQYFLISIGVATILPNPKENMSSKNIITLVNKALYVANKGGKDKLIIVSMPHPIRNDPNTSVKIA